ncbi:MAG: transporter, family, cyanate transporter [Solirubrobacteraceae bacterium]|nr:transporter, family, cyanate transporter [Solirubrobacteraceae bacterium]
MRASLAIIAAAFNLRIGVVAVGPLIDRIRAATRMSATLAGALGSIPFLCMGVFALVGVPLVRRLGARRLITWALVLLVAGTLVRAIAPSGALIVIATIPIGIAIALMGLALPGVIKRHFPARLGAGTGAYVAALSVGAAIIALVAVPLADALGGWREAFAITALPTAAALPLWLLLPRDEAEEPRAGESRADERRADARRAERAPRPRLLPSRLGWHLAALFGLQSMCFAAMINWIAALYVQAGWSVGAAAITTATISIVTIPAALLIPGLSDGRDRGKFLMAAAVSMSVGMLGLAFAPTSAPWLWIAAFSVGNGSLFPLALTLPLDLGERESAATQLTAWMLGFGYILSATGPLIVGGLHDLTGGFTLPVALLGAFGIGSGLLALAPRLRRRAEAVGGVAQPVPRI